MPESEYKKSNKMPGMLALLLSLIVLPIALLLGSLLYITKYKVETVDTQQSPDNLYEVELQSVGEPDFPFGSASGRLVLRKEGVVLSTADMEIANDGAAFTDHAWNVTWYDDYVEIILSGEEQYDERIQFYYDGQIQRERLDTHYGKTHEDRYSTETDLADDVETGEEELFSDQWLIEEGYLAICEFLTGNRSDSFEIRYGASESSARCIVSENEDTIEYLIYDRYSQNQACGLYVYYRSQKTDDGAWSTEDADILDIYAYVYESGTVISSGKTNWESVGSAAYLEATGENN